MAHIQLEPAPKEIRECIQECLDCYDACVQTEAHCLRLGEGHAEAQHIHLLEDCARLCQVTAEFLLRTSRFQGELARLTAEACSQCEADCRRFDGDRQMRKCAGICASCAESLRRMK